MKVSEYLAEPERWGKGTDGLKDCDCVDTAIGFCYDSIVDDRDARKRFLEAIGLTTDGTPLDWMTRIWQWNDAPERTHAEVLAACKAAGI